MGTWPKVESRLKLWRTCLGSISKGCWELGGGDHAELKSRRRGTDWIIGFGGKRKSREKTRVSCSEQIDDWLV